MSPDIRALREQLGLWVMTLSVTAVLGTALVLASAAGLKWLAMTVFAYLALIVFAWFPDRRLFLILLLIACIPVWMQYRLLTHGSKTVAVYHHGGALPEPVINLVDIPLALLLVMWIVDLALGKRSCPDWHPVDTAIVAFLLSCLLSLYTTTEYALFWFELLRYLKFYLLFWICRTYLSTDNYLFWVAIVSALVLMFQTLVASLQYLYGFTLPIPVGGTFGTHYEMKSGILINRVGGLVGSYNTFATYAAVSTLIFTTMFVVCQKITVKMFFGIAMTCGMIALLMTFSRNNMLALAISGTVLIWFSLQQRRLGYGSFMMMLGLAFVVLIGAIGSGIFERLLLRILDREAKELASRWDLLAIAWRMFLENPLMGVGLNSFVENMSSFDRHGITNVLVQPVHNVFALILAETGVISLAISIWIGSILMADSLALLRQSHFVFFAVGAITGCGFLCLGLSSLLDLTLRNDPILGIAVVLAAITVNYAQRARSQQTLGSSNDHIIGG